MRNPALNQLAPLLGRWHLRLSGASFLEPADTELHGWASFEWLGDAFVVMRSQMDEDPMHDLVFGHSDARHTFGALYHDQRGVSRMFDMTFDAASWTMTRQDPDFHQRFLAELKQDAILGRWDASEDEGRTWRKDFDLTFTR